MTSPLTARTTLPTGEPLAGRWVRLDALGEADLDELYPILADPAVYAHGYVMHRRPPRRMRAIWPVRGS